VKNLRMALLPLPVVIARSLVLVASALMGGAFAILVVAALREGRGDSAGQEAQRGQGEEKVLHKIGWD
jgi:hypothetical protein